MASPVEATRTACDSTLRPGRSARPDVRTVARICASVTPPAKTEELSGLQALVGGYEVPGLDGLRHAPQARSHSMDKAQYITVGMQGGSREGVLKHAPFERVLVDLFDERLTGVLYLEEADTPPHMIRF